MANYSDNLYIKTKIGEHDFHKPACYKYCKLSKEFCPFVRDDISLQPEAIRWTDIADEKLNNKINSSNNATTFKQIGKYQEKSSSNIDFGQEIANGRYTCWGDGSGFEYDMMSTNIIGGPQGPAGKSL